MFNVVGTQHYATLRRPRCETPFSIKKKKKKKNQRAFSLSCAQCNAYLLYCVRNKQPARGQRAVNIHFWSDSIASLFCHLFAWKFFLYSENILRYRSMFHLRSSGEGNILTCVSITWVYLANRWLALDLAIQYYWMFHTYWFYHIGGLDLWPLRSQENRWVHLWQRKPGETQDNVSCIGDTYQ